MIKRTLLVLIICFSALYTSYSQNNYKVLFIGNSYTYANDLPSVIRKVALSHGNDITYDQSTPGGYTMEGHSTYTTTLNKIASDNWDFVVIQGQSQRPSFPPSQVEVEVYPYAEILVDSIKSNYSCSEPLFFMTWGRKDGDQANCVYYEPLCTFEGMQMRLRESYLQMAQDNDAAVSPVGMAWRMFRSMDTITNLYSSDGSHPSEYGTYLSALVFYSTIFRESSVGSDTLEIPSETAYLMQGITDDIVFDSLSQWIGSGITSYADIDYEIGSYGHVDLWADAINTDTYFWDLDDNGTTTDISVSQNFNTGLHEIFLTVENECSSFTDSTSFEIPMGFDDMNNDNTSLYPVPFTNKLIFKGGSEEYDIEIFNTIGQKCFEEDNVHGDIQITTTNWYSGIYIVKIHQKGNTICKKVSKTGH
jgi:hypothetical protein